MTTKFCTVCDVPVCGTLRDGRSQHCFDLLHTDPELISTIHRKIDKKIRAVEGLTDRSLRQSSIQEARKMRVRQGRVAEARVRERARQERIDEMEEDSSRSF